MVDSNNGPELSQLWAFNVVLLLAPAPGRLPKGGPTRPDMLEARTVLQVGPMITPPSKVQQKNPVTRHTVLII
jgi:hypothetical protein